MILRWEARLTYGHSTDPVQALSLRSMPPRPGPERAQPPLTLGSSFSAGGALGAAGALCCFFPFWAFKSLQGPPCGLRPAIRNTSLELQVPLFQLWIWGIPEGKLKDIFQIHTDTNPSVHRRPSDHKGKAQNISVVILNESINLALNAHSQTHQVALTVHPPAHTSHSFRSISFEITLAVKMSYSYKTQTS